MTNLIPVENRFKFFVYIIESPSDVDLYLQRTEGNVLQQAVRLNLIQCEHRLAINSRSFRAALQVGLTEAMGLFAGAIPILHISAHGFSEGIQLSSGEVLNWAQLRELLLPINKALNGSLIVCMSTCEGYSGARMAMVANSDENPFLALVGNGSKPTWPETAVAFSTFYHLIANGYYVSDAVDAMRTASGNNKFYVTTAEESKQGYLDFIKTLDAAEVKDDLEQKVESEMGSELQKYTRVSSA